MGNWECFVCGSLKSGIGAPCPVCDAEVRSNVKLVQNNVHLYEDGPFTQAMLRIHKDDVEIEKEYQEKIREIDRARRLEEDKFGQNLSSNLLKITLAAATWTALAAVWMALFFFGLVIKKAFFGG